MKIKQFSEKYEKKVKKIDKKPKKFIDVKWVITITACAFLISLLLSSFTEILVSNLNAFIAILIVILIIIIAHI